MLQLSRHIVMPIGLHDQIRVDLWLDTASSWAIALFHGKQKSNTLCHEVLQKLNIGVCPPLFVNCYGLAICWGICIKLSINQYQCGVIAKLCYIPWPILFSINTFRHWLSLGTNTKMGLFCLNTSVHMINWMICSRNRFLVQNSLPYLASWVCCRCTSLPLERAIKLPLLLA